jgi:hypothetical protein
MLTLIDIKKLDLIYYHQNPLRIKKKTIKIEKLAALKRNN